jgi:hypothetical protein
MMSGEEDHLMSVVAATISIDDPRTTIRRAYADLAAELSQLAGAVRDGRLPARAVPLPVRSVVVERPAAAVPSARAAGGAAARSPLRAFTVDVVKVGVAALVLYQGIHVVLPSPPRPVVVDAVVGASPVDVPAVPTVAPAAPGAAGGLDREVTDGVGTREPAVP